MTDIVREPLGPPPFVVSVTIRAADGAEATLVTGGAAEVDLTADPHWALAEAFGTDRTPPKRDPSLTVAVRHIAGDAGDGRWLVVDTKAAP